MSTEKLEIFEDFFLLAEMPEKVYFQAVFLRPVSNI
jgi:hypothetical protein